MMRRFGKRQAIHSSRGGNARIVTMNVRRPTDSPPSHETLSAKLAHWSQVGMLIVVLIGYFYTVRPIYQKDRLEEEVAALYADKARAEEQRRAEVAQLNQAQVAVSEMAQERERLRAENAALSAAQSELSGAIANSRRDAVRAEARVALLAKKVDEQATNLKAGQEALFRQQAPLYWIAPLWNEARGSFPFDADEKDSVAEWAKAPQRESFAFLVDQVEKQLRDETYFGLPEPRELSKEIVARFRSDLDRSRQMLTCPVVDKSEWVESWTVARATVQSGVSDCVLQSLDRVRLDQGWEVSELEAWRSTTNGQAQEAIFGSSCRSLGDFNVDRIFNDAWRAIREACDDRVYHVFEVVSGQRAPKPFPELAPPSPQVGEIFESRVGSAPKP